MREFFKDWKRTLGIVTLLTASVFTVGWVRSFRNRESLYLPLWQVRTAVISVDGKLGIFQSHINHPESGFDWITLPIAAVYGQQSVDAEAIFNVVPGNGNEFELRFRFSGFDLGQVRPGSAPHHSIPFIFVPYWSITIPLVLLSAWLLLSKLREPNPRATI
ncbi:hypothetical protein [Schlesneria paludicola]|uniref:hypothetical protein n=1 Tax=Schlesneria paludicola TaxID=360056 RepID=UPI00029A5A5A|nr:hypothetical protein [Schlesneria paludicola]